MSSKAVESYSVYDGRSSFPKFKEKSDRIASLTSLAGLTAEIEKTQREYEQALFRQQIDPKMKPPTNFAQVCLVLLAHKTTQLVNELLDSGELQRNLDQYKPKLALVTQNLVVLNQTLDPLKKNTHTKKLSLLFTDCLLPHVLDDCVTFKTTLSRLKHILSSSDLEKLQNFHGILSDQIMHQIRFFEGVKAVVPSELVKASRELEAGHSKLKSQGFIHTAFNLVSNAVSWFFVRSPDIQQLVFDPRIALECRDPMHFKLLCGLEKLAQKQHGRDLIAKLTSYHTEAAPFKMYEVIKDGTCCISEKAALYMQREGHPVTVQNQDGEQEWDEFPFFCELAHEMIHRVHYLEDQDKLKKFKATKDTGKNELIRHFTDMEEYYTIMGFAVDDDGTLHQNDFSENSIRRAFGLRERTSHTSSMFPFDGPVDEACRRWTRFHSAGQLGLVGTLRKLLKHKPSIALINAQDGKGSTSLHYFTENKQTKAVELLLNAKADPRLKTTQESETCLHLSVVQKVIPIVELLFSSEYLEDPIERSKLVNAQTIDGKTALYLSLQQSCEDIALLLVANGANALITTNLGENPLHIAASKGLEEICKEILQRLPTYDKRRKLVNAQNNNKDTPLHLAVNENLAPIVELFLIHGADANLRNRNGQNSLHCATDVDSLPCVEVLLTHGDFSDIDINDRDSTGHTPLHYALLRKNVDGVRLLLEYGARRDVRHKSLGSTLDIAKRIIEPEIRKQLCDLLQDPSMSMVTNRPALLLQSAKKGDTKLCMALCTSVANVADQLGNSPLHVAILEGHQGTAAALIRRSNVNSVNKDGETPLHCSVRKGDIHSARRLLKKGASPDCLNKGSNTPVHFAALVGRLDFLELFNQFNASFDMQNVAGKTPLNVAINAGHLKCADFLILELADVNLPDKQGLTPLHTAVINESIQAVRVLMSPMTDLQTKDEEGLAPLDYAKKIKDRTIRNAICDIIETEIAEF